MYCAQCGKENEGDVKFCQFCGAKADAEGATAVQPRQPEANSGARAQYEAELKEEQDNLKIWNKGCIAGVIVIVAWLLFYYVLRVRIISAWMLLIGLLLPASIYFRIEAQNKIKSLKQTLSNMPRDM